MISTELLLEKGYEEYASEEFGNRNFQKKFTNDYGVMYFISCHYYYFTQPSGKQLRFWDFKMQLETMNGAVEFTTVQWFNQDGKHSNNTIEDVEKYFQAIWEWHDKPYYEEY